MTSWRYATRSQEGAVFISGVRDGCTCTKDRTRGCAEILHEIALAMLNRRAMSECSEESAGRQQVVTETATRNTQGPVAR